MCIRPLQFFKGRIVSVHVPYTDNLKQPKFPIIMRTVYSPSTPNRCISVDGVQYVDLSWATP